MFRFAGESGHPCPFPDRGGSGQRRSLKYNEILVGVRAYAVRDDLRTYNGRLLDYVKHGGAVVVQYQTPEFDHNFGPYPYV